MPLIFALNRSGMPASTSDGPSTSSIPQVSGVCALIAEANVSNKKTERIWIDRPIGESIERQSEIVKHPDAHRLRHCLWQFDSIDGRPRSAAPTVTPYDSNYSGELDAYRKTVGAALRGRPSSAEIVNRVNSLLKFLEYKEKTLAPECADERRSAAHFV